MKKKNDSLVALLGAVLCVCACLVGCERKDAVPSSPPVPEAKPAATSVVSRANDAAYQAQVKGFATADLNIHRTRAKIEARIEQLRARAKAALPADATDEQVAAELENNPGKYPAWRELDAARKANLAEEEKNRAAAQSAVRQRILREVAEGRAQGAPAAEKK